MLNIIGFNSAWFGLVYFGNEFVPVALALLFIHLAFLSNYNDELLLVLAVCAIGTSVDSLLTYFDVFIFAEQRSIPIWLITLWACFASTLSHGLGFFGHATWLKVIAGCLAPLSYIGGQQFNAVIFGQPLFTTYLVLALVWSGLFILFFYLKTQLIHEAYRDV